MKKQKINSKTAAADLGSLGGKATVKKHGKDYMRKLGKKGGDSRWAESDKK